MTHPRAVCDQLTASNLPLVGARPTAEPQAWTPPRGVAVELVPAGVWWDAVRVPRWIAEHALRTLGESGGAVIEDGYGAWLYWLIPVGMGKTDGLAHAQLLGHATWVAVPPAHRTTGPDVTWRFLPDVLLTDPARLRAALRQAERRAVGPRGGSR